MMFSKYSLFNRHYNLLSTLCTCYSTTLVYGFLTTSQKFLLVRASHAQMDAKHSAPPPMRKPTADMNRALASSARVGGPAVPFPGSTVSTAAA